MIPPRLKAISLVAVQADNPITLAENVTAAIQEKSLDLYGTPQLTEGPRGRLWVQFLTEIVLVVQTPDTQPSNIVGATFVPRAK